jgi:hypothetical protein
LGLFSPKWIEGGPNLMTMSLTVPADAGAGWEITFGAEPYSPLEGG